MATVEPLFGLREPAEVVGDGSAKATGVGFTVQQFSA
jgi:hypothetical protein